MRSVLILISIALSMPVFALKGSLNGETKSELKKLYYRINSSDDPHTDKEVKKDVTRLVGKSCNESAMKALKKRKHVPAAQMAKMKGIMSSTCSCVAEHDDMIKGVIDSAVLFKEHGKHSVEARKAMQSGMKTAKKDCFKKMRSNMSRSQM